MASRRRPLGPLIVANPNPDSDSDSVSASDEHPNMPFSPPGALSNIEPPAPINFGSSNLTQSPNPPDDVSGSSRSSPAPSSTPPRTPGHMQPPPNLIKEPQVVAPAERPYASARGHHLGEHNAAIYGIAHGSMHSHRPSNEHVRLVRHFIHLRCLALNASHSPPPISSPPCLLQSTHALLWLPQTMRLTKRCTLATPATVRLSARTSSWR